MGRGTLHWKNPIRNCDVLMKWIHRETEKYVQISCRHCAERIKCEKYVIVFEEWILSFDMVADILRIEEYDLINNGEIYLYFIYDLHTRIWFDYFFISFGFCAHLSIIFHFLFFFLERCEFFCSDDIYLI